MKKKYLLLLLIGATAFASTGEVNLGMKPKFVSTYESTSNSFNTTKNYSLPYDFTVNYDEQGISFGVADGTYNDGTEIGKFDVLKNNANLWGSYSFDIAPHQSGMLKVENKVDVQTAGQGTIGTKFTGQYKYDNDFATYTGKLSYEGAELIFAPKSVELNNKVDLLDDYTLNLNFKNEFATSTFANKLTVDFNGEVRKFGVKVQPGYKLFVTTDTAKKTALSNEAKLDVLYSKDFDVVKLDASLKNKVAFDFSDAKSTFAYTVNPKVAVSKSFNLDPVTFDTKLTLEDKFVVSNLTSATTDNTFTVTPHLGASVAVTDKVKLSSGIDVVTTVSNKTLKDITTKLNLGFNYKW